MNLRLHVMQTDEVELHERSPQCRCKPKVVMEYNADYGTMTTTVKHNRLKPAQDQAKAESDFSNEAQS